MITQSLFQPEVYLYPTPRMYNALVDFTPDTAFFTDDMNIYIHIPFCKQICSFCGYLKTIDSIDLRAHYVDAIIEEIKLYCHILNGKKIKTLHFGGGTPSLLAPEDLKKIFTYLLKINPSLFKTSEEVSIEATPESIEENKFIKFRQLGINRVSIGVQSFNDAEIKLTGRRNLSDISVKAVKILQKINIPNIVLDLMIGIEGQTVQSFEKSVKTILELRPETVELYALGLMPQTYLGKQQPETLMSSKEIYCCYEIGRDLFLKAGYAQDCHNRYVLPQKGSFLQEDYVLQGMSLVGFGAGARSYATNIHYRNIYDIHNSRRAIMEYINNIFAGKYAIESGIRLSNEEKIRQYIIGHIEKLNKNDFKERFGFYFEKIFQELYCELMKSNLAIDDGYFIQLTAKGLIFRDLIAMQFFSDAVKRAETIYRPKR